MVLVKPDQCANQSQTADSGRWWRWGKGRLQHFPEILNICTSDTSTLTVSSKSPSQAFPPLEYWDVWCFQSCRGFIEHGISLRMGLPCAVSCSVVGMSCSGGPAVISFATTHSGVSAWLPGGAAIVCWQAEFSHPPPPSRPLRGVPDWTWEP